MFESAVGLRFICYSCYIISGIQMSSKLFCRADISKQDYSIIGGKEGLFLLPQGKFVGCHKG